MRASSDLQARIEASNRKVFEAQMQQQWVEAREPIMSKLGDELRETREKNHFTELFIKTLGGS